MGLVAVVPIQDSAMFPVSSGRLKGLRRRLHYCLDATDVRPGLQGAQVQRNTFLRARAWLEMAENVAASYSRVTRDSADLNRSGSVPLRCPQPRK